jgi:hypothetical protein
LNFDRAARASAHAIAILVAVFALLAIARQLPACT